MQQTVESTKKIFNENGEVTFGGWSRSPVFEYNKSDYQNKFKLCERDAYYITNGKAGLYLSVETVGTELTIKLVFADFETKEILRDSITRKLMLEQKALPEYGNVGEFSYTDKKIALTLTNTVDGRYIKCDFIDFNNFKNLYVKVLVKKLAGESMNTVAPFNGAPRCFYLKRFVPKFCAEGVIRVGGSNYELNEYTSPVYFDWTRSVFPRKQRLLALKTVFDNGTETVALNLSSRIGNNAKGSENSYFINNRLFKISRLKVVGDEGRKAGDWDFSTADGTVNLSFTPDKKLSCKCDKLNFTFGTISGTLEGRNKIITIENKPAHMITGTI